MSRKRSTFKTIGRLFILLIAVVSVSFGALVCISGMSLRAHMSRHMPTLEELAGPKVPDDQNGALVYNQAFKALKAPGLHEALLNMMDRFHATKDTKRSPEFWMNSQQTLARFQGVMDLVENAQSYPQCQFITNWRNAADHYPYKNLIQLRELARIFRCDAIVAAKDGDTNRSVKSIEMGFRLTKAVEREPMSMPLIVRAAIASMMSRSLQDSLQYTDINEAQAHHLFDTLGTIDLYRGYGKMLQGERVVGLDYFNGLHKSPGTLAKNLEFADTFSNAFLGEKRKTSPIKTKLISYSWWSAFYGLDKSAYMEAMYKQIANAKLPYYKAESIHLLPDENDLPSYAIVTRMIIPVLRKTAMVRDRGMADLSASRVFLAVLAHKDRFGSYPSSLTEVKSKLGWKLPDDPFNGKDFIYRKQGKGFLLYSIGVDLKDDNGKPSPGGSDPGDIVWKMER